MYKTINLYYIYIIINDIYMCVYVFVCVYIIYIKLENVEVRLRNRLQV